ncbi:MAG: EAL domain-containing protein [Thermoanaerobaculia bacterium]
MIALQPRTDLLHTAPDDGLWLLTAFSQDDALGVRFERIVERKTGALHGLEALCRVRNEDLPLQPHHLFRLAEEEECATELSELMRRRAAAAMAVSTVRLFLNTHPAEFRDIPRLLYSLDELRGCWPALRLVLEIHEEAEVSVLDLKILRRELARMRIEMAYDDFGTGRGRLRELVEVPPDYLKIGYRVVQSVRDARSSARGVIQGLLRMASSVGARVVAEGPESDLEQQACWDLDFDLCQRHDEPARDAGLVSVGSLMEERPCLISCA